MAELEQLKQKYASVLQLIQSRNVRLDHLHVQDGKLLLQGAAPNEKLRMRCGMPSKPSIQLQ